MILIVLILLILLGGGGGYYRYGREAGPYGLLWWVVAVLLILALYNYLPIHLRGF